MGITGQEIARRRKVAKVKQDVFAQMVGVRREYLSAIENERQVPGKALAKRIAEELDRLNSETAQQHQQVPPASPALPQPRPESDVLRERIWSELVELVDPDALRRVLQVTVDEIARQRAGPGRAQRRAS